MSKNKKNAPGRPKKEFVSHKPKTKIKSGPGRPRKDPKGVLASHKVPAAIAGYVAKSVDDSKKKDIIILVLFILSFMLFISSIYFTFMRDKKSSELSTAEMAEITNIETGNIDYTTSDSGNVSAEQAPTVVVNTVEEQTIVDFYQAVNVIDTEAIYTLTDAHLEASNVFKTYYSKSWLSRFLDVIIAPKIVVSNIQEQTTNSSNPNIKNFAYTLEYMLASNQQKYTEERSTVLIKKGDNWRIGKLLCETKGCSTMPFFNPEKYK